MKLCKQAVPAETGCLFTRLAAFLNRNEDGLILGPGTLLVSLGFSGLSRGLLLKECSGIFGRVAEELQRSRGGSRRQKEESHVLVGVGVGKFLLCRVAF